MQKAGAHGWARVGLGHLPILGSGRGDGSAEVYWSLIGRSARDDSAAVEVTRARL